MNVALLAAELVASAMAARVAQTRAENDARVDAPLATLMEAVEVCQSELTKVAELESAMAPPELFTYEQRFFGHSRDGRFDAGYV